MERYYPELENRPDVPRDVAEAFRLVFDNLYELRDDVRREDVSPIAPPRLGSPDFDLIRRTLQASGRNSINVTGLLGLLAEPQIAGAPSVTVLPSTSDPQSQDGALVSLNNALYRFDETTQPGFWAALAANGVIGFGLRSAKPAGGNAGTTFFETDTTWTYFDDGSVFKFTAGVYKATDATRAALSVGVNDNGALFYATDTDVWWRVSVGNWSRMWPFHHDTDFTPVTVNADLTTAQNLMNLSVPAGALNRIGRTVKIFGAGVYTTQAAETPTITITVSLGALTLATWVSSATTASATDIPFNFNLDLTTVTVGAAATMESHGNMIFNLGTTAGVDSEIYPDTNTAVLSSVDLTGALTLQVTVTFSTQPSTPFNAATQRQLTLGIVN